MTKLVRVCGGLKLLGLVWFGMLALVSVGSEARAQCSAGNAVGACPPNVGFEGCCTDSATVAWCEGGSLCELDCTGNVDAPVNTCCQESATSAGCCDLEVMACVCDIDAYCCDADPFMPGGVWDYFCVQYAMSSCGGCGTGCSGPATFCGWSPNEGFYDCRSTASSDPSGLNPASCGGGTGCQPQCAGRQCGPDGCGGICGQCASNQTCNAGQCLGGTCTPQCAGKTCGSDGCGGVCGQCTSGQTCDSNGLCQSSGCVPSCSGKECGSNGCGGICGQCLSSETCVSGQCQTGGCEPSCAGLECGEDGCGGSCGQCGTGQACSNGRCVGGCEPACVDKQCGDDGCGGTCGECGEGEVCRNGECESECSCSGRSCGDDGCGRTCGFCGPNTTCNATTYQCDPVNQGGTTDVVSEPTSCPEGQIWSQYAAACVVDPNAGATSGSGASDSGCEGGHASGVGGLLMGLLAVLARRYRTLKS